MLYVLYLYDKYYQLYVHLSESINIPVVHADM